MSCKRGALRNFTKFTRKYLCPLATLLKKRPWHRRFPVKFAEFLRTPFLTETLWWLLLRAANFVSMLRLCTIQITSHSLAKAHLRIPFLQNSSQWLLSNVSYFFLKREKQKQFFMPPLTLKRVKTRNGIKIRILFIHDFEKKPTRIYLPIFSI